MQTPHRSSPVRIQTQSWQQCHPLHHRATLYTLRLYFTLNLSFYFICLLNTTLNSISTQFIAKNIIFIYNAQTTSGLYNSGLTITRNWCGSSVKVGPALKTLVTDCVDCSSSLSPQTVLSIFIMHELEDMP